MRLAVTIGIGLVAVATGCGRAPTQPKAPHPHPAATALPTPGLPVAPVDGETLLAQVRQAFETCTGAEAEAKATSEGHYKAGAKVNELRRSTYVTKMLWVKPRKVRGEVLQTDNFLVGGAKMASLDGKRVRVKGAGLLGLLPLTLDAGDDLLSSNRRHKFSDQTPDAICRRLLGTGVRWTLLGNSTVSGIPVRMIEVEGAPHLDKEITREVVAIDPAAAALRGVTMYAGNHVVVDVKFTRFRWNPTPSPDAFDL